MGHRTQKVSVKLLSAAGLLFFFFSGLFFFFSVFGSFSNDFLGFYISFQEMNVNEENVICS